MIMDLIDEAVAYLRANDLITVPAIAAETVHMTMLSPQQQLTSPFFLGGVGGILVSYPTDTMEYDARLQSMRGNNPGFSHATAFHETIPGTPAHGLPRTALRRLPPGSHEAAGRSTAKAGRSTGS